MHPARLSALGARIDFPAINRLMVAALETPGMRSLAAGLIDGPSLPAEHVARLLDDVARRAPPSREFLQYGTHTGRAGLRAAIAARLARQDRTAPQPDRAVFITNGSQQALHLAAQTLCDPGDIVLVERPTYFVFLDVLRGLGVEARSLPVDGLGRPDAAGLEEVLETLARRGELARLKAVYWISHHANPSGSTLPAPARAALARVLAHRAPGVAVIEDAAYRELAFDGSTDPVSLLALPEADAVPVLHLGTFTKPFATGIKVGFGVCNDAVWLAKMLHLKGHADFGTANVLQAIVERALEDGTFDAHLARMRPLYAEKRDVLDRALRDAGLDALGWAWDRPEGGLYLWLRAPEGVDAGLDAPLFRACLDERVVYTPGCLCFADAPDARRVRLSFGALPPGELADAGARFARAARAVQPAAAGC